MLSDQELIEQHRGQWSDYLDRHLGEPIAAAVARPETIESFRGRLPGGLLDAWSQHGFAGFGDGLVWLVNPDDYGDVVADWVEGTAVENLDTYHVIARGAFGDLVVWAERTCTAFTLNVSMALFAAAVDDLRGPQTTELEQEQGWRSFLRSYGPKRKRLDCTDAAGNGLFDACLTRHGRLIDTQVYGFAPYLFTGGDAVVENTAVVDQSAQLAVISEFTNKPLFKDISTFPG